MTDEKKVRSVVAQCRGFFASRAEFFSSIEKRWCDRLHDAILQDAETHALSLDLFTDKNELFSVLNSAEAKTRNCLILLNLEEEMRNRGAS